MTFTSQRCGNVIPIIGVVFKSFQALFGTLDLIYYISKKIISIIGGTNMPKEFEKCQMHFQS